MTINNENIEDLEERFTFRNEHEEGTYKPSRLSFQITQISRSSPSLDLPSALSNFEQTTPAVKISKKLFFLLAFKSVGVIFGDIGTSPLYTIKSIFSGQEPIGIDVIGVVSLLIWTIITLVTIKYIIFVLMADSSGEGGTFALLSLLRHPKSGLSNRTKTFFTFVVLIGASFVLGDGVLTPSISVLSAVEGLQIASESIVPYIVPIACVILVLLFILQSIGTSKIGFLFSPIMCLWFLSLGGIGLYRIVFQPTIFQALNPGQAVSYLIRHGYDGFVALGSVFLAVTGLEALYADLGHFGRGSIRLSWLALVFPMLVLNYLGQGATLLEDPSKITDPFYYAVPTPLYWPMFVLAILATVIASQAMITGAFSLLSQAVNLNYFPSVTIRHTSEQVYGQVYIPEINFLLLALCIIIVVAFQKSELIGHAYGLTVCTDMVLTTILYSCQLRFYRKYPWPFVIFFFIVFFPYDIILFASNTLKVPNGGWVSLLFAFCFLFIMLIWYFGERRFHKSLKQIQRNVSIRSLLHEQSDKMIRTPGMGVFLTPIQHRVPRAFTNFVSRVQVIPEVIVFLTIKFEKKPFVDPHSALHVKSYGQTLYRVIARRGFLETRTNVETIISDATRRNLLPQVNHYTFFLNTENLQVKKRRNFIKYFVYSVYCFLKTTFKGRSTKLITPVESTIEVGVQATL